MSDIKLPGEPPVLRVAPMPADVNQNGDIFGGWIMSQADIAGGILAQLRSRGRVAAVAVNSFTFKHPVLVGAWCPSLRKWRAWARRRSP